MAEELTPGQVQSRRFDVVRKGYERGQVELFLAELGNHIELLQDELAASSEAGVALGIGEQEALARELHTIGEQVSDILEAARNAAEGIRTRANKDAEQWRTAAESESSGMVIEATEQTQSLRASAWNEGSSLLSSASAEAQSIVAGAKEEALFVRAEAEREAIRLTGDAKRDREEMLRAARAEAEQIIELARNESDSVLMAASQQAELAQERARALEDRRSELLGELEATRASIGELETEIESRKLELEPPEEPEGVFDDPDPERTHHTTDSGSVKIVAPTRVASMRPVDAEELVAEVTALRAGEAAIQAAAEAVPASLEPTQAVPQVESLPAPAEPGSSPIMPIAEEVASADDETTEIDVVADVAPEPADVTPPVEVGAVLELDPAGEDDGNDEDHGDAVDDGEPDAPVGGAPSPAEPELVEPQGDDLGSLFAQLRDTPAVALAENHESAAAVDGATEEAVSTPVTTEPQQPTTPAPTVDIPDVPPADEEVAALLIPLQNAALRSIKRTLVDLQNEALEHLRTDADWMPDEAFTDRFDEPFAELTLAATGEPDTSASSAFGTDLYDAVSSAMERSRDAGAGERELAAATSKVFRTWRSDEAERRVADVG